MSPSHSRQIQSYYDVQAKNYNELFFDHPGSYPTLLYRQAHILNWIRQLSLPRPFLLADLGCGTGDLLKELVDEDCTLYGLDFSEEMVDIARKKNSVGIANGKVDVLQGDVEHLPDALLQKQFDVVILSGVIEYLSSDDLWLASVQRILKKGGYLIVNVTNPYCIRRITQGPFERMKKWSLFRKAGNFIKSQVFKKGPLHYFDFTIRLHAPGQFDQLMQKHQFVKKRHRYFDFACLPYPFDKAFERFTLPWKKRMELVEDGKQSIWGGGYIGLYQLKT